MTDIDLAQAVEVAAPRYALLNHSEYPWDIAHAEFRDLIRAEVAAVLRLAAPLIEAQVREQVAREIEAEGRRHDAMSIGFSGKGDTYADAARIARGGAR